MVFFRRRDTTLEQFFEGVSILLKSILAGLNAPVLFLKATVRKQVYIAQYTRSDGTVVPGHHTFVHVSTDHDPHRVLSGQGSHSQRQAHARLQQEPWFHDLEKDHRVNVLLEMATELQTRASMSAAVSGWKSTALAGRNPSASQWAAFHRLAPDRQSALMDEVTTAVGNSNHLQYPSVNTQEGAAATSAVAAPVTPVVAIPATAPTPAPLAPGPVVMASIDPVPQHLLPAHVHAAMMAIPVPVFPDTSETNRSTTRRSAQLRAFAERGDIDSIVNFAVSRTRPNFSRVANYRDALLSAAQAPTAAQASAAVSTPIPEMPDIRGANMENTALLAARRKVAILYDAANTTTGDPIARILAVPTSRGNNYLNAVDDYKTRLLLHFGVDRSGNTIAGATAESGTSTAQTTSRSPAVVSASVRTAPARRSLASSTPAALSVPPSQNPRIAANPLGLSEEVLGFVPRPNIPLTTHVGHSLSDPNFRWPSPEMRALAIRYMAQSTALQSRAKDYQAGRWIPETPEVRIARERAAQEAAAVRRAQEMQEIRVSARKFEDRLASMEDFFKPVATVGANLNAPIKILGEEKQSMVRRILGVHHETAERLFSEMICDYGGGVKFTATVIKSNDNELDVQYRGSDGTQITRRFSRVNGKLQVYHAFFEAGSTGEGSGKKFFRTSMGVYKNLGVSNVKVYANISVGGYAWARYGYLPNNVGEIAALIRHGIRRFSSSLTDKQKNTLLRLSESTDPRMLWKLSDMQFGDRKIGKEILLGNSWHGNMRLDDEHAMSRFRAYVA